MVRLRVRLSRGSFEDWAFECVNGTYYRDNIPGSSSEYDPQAKASNILDIGAPLSHDVSIRNQHNGELE